MSAPEIHGLAALGVSHDTPELRALEEKLVLDVFAAFRQTYLAGLQELAGDEEPEAAKQPLAASGAKGAW